MTAKALMLQGTGSDVGKSLLVAGLCRAYTKRGLRVLPFKPQNMSNNAAVTADGGEIGRAQALQAKACGVALHTDMNPVLLKPQSQTGSQVIVCGKIYATVKARAYQNLKPELMTFVQRSFKRVCADADLVLVEGAGSPAEVNLRKGDIANMGFACAARVPVILTGDIDRGGVIAQLVGTYELLPPGERALVAGYIINKFRGDVSLFDGGLAVTGARTGWRSFGVVPYFSNAAKLPPEDAVALPPLISEKSGSIQKQAIKIAVPVLPYISNFDDLDPLRAEPDVSLHMVALGETLPLDADLIILPGSKATIADLAEFKNRGWDIDLAAHVRRGGSVLGICGGYQMLGTCITDPKGIEGSVGHIPGLGLLPVTTELTGDKQLTEVGGVPEGTNTPVSGYHMHVGRTRTTAGNKDPEPWLRFDGKGEGAVSDDGRIRGAYIHGLFAGDAFRHVFLSALKTREASNTAYDQQVEDTLDELALHLEACLDTGALLAAARVPFQG